MRRNYLFPDSLITGRDTAANGEKDLMPEITLGDFEMYLLRNVEKKNYPVLIV